MPEADESRQHANVALFCNHCGQPIELEVVPNAGYPMAAVRVPNVFLCPHPGCGKSNVLELPGRVVGVRQRSQ
jgi:hypothetical protein